MVLSNLVEEKANKIIEMLAAAIPMEAVFLGKLFAMLAVSLVGIAVWATVISGLVTLRRHGRSVIGGVDRLRTTSRRQGSAGRCSSSSGSLYFAMGYLLLGSIFLAIGSMAKTVREVQTLSMPVTMLQLLVFFFASLCADRDRQAARTGRDRLPAQLALRDARPGGDRRGALAAFRGAGVAGASAVAIFIKLGSAPVPPPGDAVGPAARRSSAAR